MTSSKVLMGTFKLIHFISLSLLILSACGPGLRLKRPGSSGAGAAVTARSYFNKARGFNDLLTVVAVAGSRVYAGGNFASLDRTSARGIAALTSEQPDPSFATGAGFDGEPYAIAPAQDGTEDIYIGGNFTSYNGTSNVRRITRLNADGSIDSGFNTGSGGTAGFNSLVFSIAPAVDGSGDVYVGGIFTTYNGTSNVRRITRLNADGSRDAGFNIGVGASAGFDGEVRTIAPALDGSGDIYVGGQFASYRGTTNANRIIRLNSDGSIDAGFNIGAGASAGFDSSVQTLAVALDSSGDVYVGGDSTTYNSATNINRITRLNSDGSIDSGFNIGSGALAGFDSPVQTISTAQDGSGDVYVGGFFSSYNGTPNVNFITRLNPDGTIDAAFDTGTSFNLSVRTIAYTNDSTGDIYVGGEFTSYSGASGVRFLTRLNSNGTIDSGFNLAAGESAALDTTVLSVAPAVDASGDVYLGGNFTSYNGTTNVNRIARLNSDGALDFGFNSGTGGSAGFNGTVWTIAPAQDGSGDIYAGGDFTAFAGTLNVNRITRLNADGSIDTAFNIGVGASAGFDNTVLAIMPAGDGSGDVYVGGLFTTYSGIPNVNRITRLNPDGSIDGGFDTGSGGTAGFDNLVQTIVAAKDGTGDVYLGGDFTVYNGTSNINRITRLNSDGTIDLGFNIGSGASAGFDAYVQTMACAEDITGDLYVGGQFLSYSGAPNVNRIARLNSDGSLDVGFDIGPGASAGFNTSVLSMAVAKDGSGDIYLGGYFASYNGTSNLNRIARLNSDGTIDTGFNTGAGASAGFSGSSDAIWSLALTQDGSGELFAGGIYTSFNGITHGYIALLSPLGLSL